MLNKRTEECKKKYEGKVYKCKDTDSLFEIKQFNAANDVIIRFLESGTEMRKSMYQIEKSGVMDPYAKSCIYCPDPKRFYEGCVYPTNEGCYMQIIEYIDCSHVKVRMRDEFGYTTVTTHQNIRKGQVHNPYVKNKFGGYEGESIYVNNKAEYEWLYRRWYNMLIRSNDVEYYLKYHGANTNAYDHVSICKEWLNYSNYATWFMANLEGLNPNYNYEVDKDLLYRFYANETNGLKCYGPKYCVLVPHEFNNALQSSTVKKYFTSENAGTFEMDVVKCSDYIKNLATNYHNDHAISDTTYNIIMNG